MSKKIVQDIIPKGNDNNVEKSSIGKSSFLNEYGHNRKDKTPLEEKSFDNRRNGKGIWKSKAVKLVAMFVFVLIIALFVPTLFSKAIVTIEPNIQKLQLNFELSATKAGIEEGGLSFDIMSIPEEKRQIEVDSIGTKEVENKASGMIRVFNSYSSKTQKLITRTQFETPDGKIYRVDDAIFVPGTKKVDGETVSGYLDVMVYADEPGEDYNIGLTTFIAPKLKGDPLFDYIYAESITPMEGGFLGVMKVISDNDRLKAENTLKSEIGDNLWQKAVNQIPDDFVIFKDSSAIDFFSNETIEGKNKNKVQIQVTGIFEALIFNKEDLSFEIAKQAGISNPENFVIHEMESLDISFITDIDDVDTIEKIVFRVNGPAIFVPKIDEESIISGLLSKKRSSYESVFSNYTDIKRAEVKLKPSWSRSFPSNPEKIEINMVVE